MKEEKIRKFADKEQRTIKQTKNSNTEAALIRWIAGLSGPIIHLLARSLEYPQRIRVGSVFEMFIVCLIVNFLIFSSFILLFLYSTVQKSAVQYSYLFIKLSL